MTSPLQMGVAVTDTIVMTRHCVFWKPIISQNVRGQNFASELADIISQYYRGTLLSEILNMPKKEGISLQQAGDMIRKLQAEASSERDFKKYHWYTANFVQVISDSGHHIEITGDEFEVAAFTPAPC